MPTASRLERFSKQYGDLGNNVLGGFCSANPLHHQPEPFNEECTCNLYVDYAERVAIKLRNVLPSVRGHLIVIEEFVFQSLSEDPNGNFKKVSDEEVEKLILYIKANSEA